MRTDPRPRQGPAPKGKGNNILGSYGPGMSQSWKDLKPFQIVSLLEMLKAYALNFYLIGGMLKSTMRIIDNAPEDRRDLPIPPSLKKNTMLALEGIHHHCSEVKFGPALKGIEWAQKEAAPDTFTYRQLGAVLGELERRIVDELDSILFMHVTTDRAKYYIKQEWKYCLLNDRAKKKFPKSIEDGDEAGKCFALGRYTACVFHLMRVMERGVQRLGKKLKVSIPVEEKDWGVISSSINGALKRLPNSTVPEKKIHARYAKAAVYLDNVRESWRNPTMHPKETYTDEEAEDCFRFVKQYVEHLATIL